jgi:hypothetical protein
MSTILIVILLIILLGGGGGYYAHNTYGLPGLGGVLGVVLIVLIVLLACGPLTRLRCAQHYTPGQAARSWIAPPSSQR